MGSTNKNIERYDYDEYSYSFNIGDIIITNMYDDEIEGYCIGANKDGTGFRNWLSRIKDYVFASNTEYEVNNY